MAKRKKSPVPNLHFDKERGTWIWRKVNPTTGVREWRDTKQTRLDLATKMKLRYEEDLRAEAAGLKTFDHFRLPVRPLANDWLASHRRIETLPEKKRAVYRALEELGIKRISDLMNLSVLHKRMRRLERRGRPAKTLRKRYQAPLKQFAKWLAGNHRYLSEDPLAAWEPYGCASPLASSPIRSAILPHMFARALAALDVLDAQRGRPSQRLLFVVLLVTAPRLSALLSRDVSNFDSQGQRIEFGASVGNKRRGPGELDSATSSDLRAALATRTNGPLFLGEVGVRYDAKRALKLWRRAMGLALIDTLWPPDLTPDLDLALLVNRALLTKKVKVGRGGNPGVLNSGTIEDRAALSDRVRLLAARFEPDWSNGLGDLHSFRMTHRTWAEVLGGVPPAVIDKQLGHSGAQAERTLEIHRLLAGSQTGRRFYLDINSELLDATQSAEAVRKILDSAEAALRKEGSALLFPGQSEASEQVG